MKERFEGPENRAVRVEVLREQKLVLGDLHLAEKIADAGELIELAAGSVVIQQHAHDSDLYFILAGAVDINVNGRIVAQRRAGDHVGEMSVIQPTQPRSATVLVTETTVLSKLTQPQFAGIAAEYPEIWKPLAKELARRLEQRNALVTKTRQKIQVFIISTAEALPIARAIQNAFAHDPFDVEVWTDDVFLVSYYPLESLEAKLDESDFAIAIATPDDQTTSRGVTQPSARDNVVFELGLFIGRLGRKRSFLLSPCGEDVKLPSDYKGVTTIKYTHSKGKLASALGPATNQMRDIINDLGPNN